MEDSAARAVLAGFIVGYAMGMVFTAAAAVLLVHLRRQFAFVEYAIAPTLSPLAVAVPVSLVSLFAWTLVGLVFGVIFYVFEDAVPRNGLGSPNLAFTAFVLAISVLPAIPWLYVLPALRRHIGVAVVSFMALFGWALPYLAA